MAPTLQTLGTLAIGLIGALFALLFSTGPASAQSSPAARPGLADPMRPPPGMPTSTRSAVPGTTGLSLPGFLPPTASTQPLAAAAPPATPASRPAPPEKPRVQALHLPREGEPSALVDGRIVKVGDRVGALTISEIDADGLVLRGGKGSERLHLIPPETRRPPAEAARETPEATPTGAPATQVAGRKEAP